MRADRNGRQRRLAVLGAPFVGCAGTMRADHSERIGTRTVLLLLRSMRADRFRSATATTRR